MVPFYGKVNNKNGISSQKLGTCQTKLLDQHRSVSRSAYRNKFTMHDTGT